ncbi:hypothetical protein NE237_027547 [Protea cynaroides]|uniref:Uncharacterized protein n=1 Tax=Protea cynaroides TaxID=273540 RepID=A0A9Q0GNK9_9MAGN|nr:hypothetical protein NE237_027547 [Protea cynaroides]
MARGKVQLKRIENPVHRQVTFCKRRTGLLKKAKELSILCDTEIGIMIFSIHGKLHQFSTKGFSLSLSLSLSLELQEEIIKLKQEIQQLHKGLGNIYGQRTEDMTLDELHALEEHLEIWMYHIRSAKTQIMFEEIQLLKNKCNARSNANPQACPQAYRTRAQARPCHNHARRTHAFSRPTRKHAHRLAGPVLTQGHAASMLAGPLATYTQRNRACARPCSKHACRFTGF